MESCSVTVRGKRETVRDGLALNVQRSPSMEKGFGFVLSSIFVGAGVALVVACGDDGNQSTFGGEGVDASTESGPGFGVDSGGSSSGSSGDGSVKATCDPFIATGYTANWTAPTHPSDAGTGPCTDPVIGTYFDECLATVGDADSKTRCDAWKAANSACGQCVETTNNSGPIQWFRDRLYYTLNVAGCIAIVQDKYGNTDCGFAYGAAVNCERDACAGCFQTGSSTFDDFRECQKKAQKTGLCMSLETQQSTTCAGVSAADGTKNCFNINNAETPKVHFSRVIKTFCGGT